MSISLLCGTQAHLHYSIALRIEFLRARARCLRYRENINILKEEQRRTIVSLEKNASIWEDRAARSQSMHSAPAVAQGAAAYASKQAAIQRFLADKFRAMWAKQDEDAKLKAARSGTSSDGDSGDETSDDEDLHVVGAEEGELEDL